MIISKIKSSIATLLVVLMVSSSSAYAEGLSPVKKGDPVPSDGFFVTTEQARTIMKDLQKIDLLELKIESLETTLQLKDNQIQLNFQLAERYKTAWEDTDDRLTTILKREGRSKFLYMLLGIGLTVGAGFALGAAN